MITTVNENQYGILDGIRKLHNDDQPFQADLTWGNGGFWKGTLVKDRPLIRMDLAPPGEASLANIQADVRALPFQPGSIKSCVYDPPFIHAHGKESVIGNRFSSYRSQSALFDLYRESLLQIKTVLSPKGLLVFKCMDIVESGKQVWNHVKIITAAQAMGYRLDDLFILTRRSVIVGHNHARQVHARKNHSYFLVFRNNS